MQCMVCRTGDYCGIYRLTIRVTEVRLGGRYVEFERSVCFGVMMHQRGESGFLLSDQMDKPMNIELSASELLATYVKTENGLIGHFKRYL